MFRVRRKGVMIRSNVPPGRMPAYTPRIVPNTQEISKVGMDSISVHWAAVKKFSNTGL